MKLNLRHPVWIAALVVTVIAVAFIGSMFFSSVNTAAASMQGCGMQHATQSSEGHAMMDGNGCPMSGKGGMMDSCAMLTGKIASVNRDGTLTVRVKPVDNAPDAVRTAIRELKAGDNVSFMMMLGKAKSSASDRSTEKAIKYTCPMHPEVISDKPGQCPKCGMNLQPVNPQDK